MSRSDSNCAVTIFRRILLSKISRKLIYSSLPWPTQTRPPALIDKQTAGHPSLSYWLHRFDLVIGFLRIRNNILQPLIILYESVFIVCAQ
jgi:hypothetical protein